MKTKLGKDLKEGDVILFWVNGDNGMRIEKIMPYIGPFDFLCGVMHLVGERDGKRVTLESSIESGMVYQLV